MIQKVLIIVPHPDDEINLAGGLYDVFKKNNVFTTVVFCTNGDYYPEYAQTRHQEVLNAKNVLGYDEAIFLGYGDGLLDSNIYNIDEDIVIKSPAGYEETYSTGSEPEFCFKKNNTHHKYTRRNLKNDIQDVILEKKADLIICVDLDCHYDHRCISLLFDEGIGEILKSNSNYRPIILKGFAYMGAWAGKDDFFSSTVKPMFPTIDRTHKDPSCTFPHPWEERVRIKNSKNTTTIKLWNNCIFRALLSHRSQIRFASSSDNALAKFPSIANPESCYWLRRSDNLLLNSIVSATSGNVCYLNDFKIFDTCGVYNKDIYTKELGWTPSIGDKLKEITIQFSNQQSINHIIIYQGRTTNIMEVRIATKDGVFETFRFNNKPGDALHIKVHYITSLLKLQITRAEIENICIHEIECYSKYDNSILDLYPLTNYPDKQRKNPLIITPLMGKIFHIIVDLILEYNRYILKRN